jgi:hypothetical protein
MSHISLLTGINYYFANEQVCKGGLVSQINWVCRLLGGIHFNNYSTEYCVSHAWGDENI